MVQPIRPAMRLPVKIAGIGALLLFPFTLPPLKYSCTARLLGPHLEEPVSTSTLVSEMYAYQSNRIWASLSRWVKEKDLMALVFKDDELKSKVDFLFSGYGDDNISLKDAIAASIVEKWEDYEITEADKDFVRDPIHYNYELTKVIVWHDNYIIEIEDVQIARTYKNTLFALAATQNETYQIEWEDLKIYFEEPESMFAKGLKLNPKLDEALKKYRAEYNEWQRNKQNINVKIQAMN